MSDLIPLAIEGQTYWIKLIVVQELGGDQVILGRDFLTIHDVLVDVQRRRITIRNPGRKYQVKTSLHMDEERINYLGEANHTFTIPGEEISAIPFIVRKKRNDKGKSRRQGNW